MCVLWFKSCFCGVKKVGVGVDWLFWLCIIPVFRFLDFVMVVRWWESLLPTLFKNKTIDRCGFLVFGLGCA